ncbi:TPA: replicative helicase loader/inhibitor [Legionella pneumophila]
MVEVIPFRVKDAFKRSGFHYANESIESIYIEIAEYALTTLYQVYPFAPAFEDVSKDDPNEQFKRCVTIWADFFMSENMSSIEKMNDAIQTIIRLGRMFPPSLPEVIHAYHGRLEKLRDNELVQYALYIQSKCQYVDNNPLAPKVIKDALPFDAWQFETSINMEKER